MELSDEQVRQIAELAKLDLTDEEVSTYASQLSEILQYFELLQDIDTSEIQATASVLPLTNVLRSDVRRDALPPQRVIANAPEAVDNQFVVSAVMGEE